MNNQSKSPKQHLSHCWFLLNIARTASPSKRMDALAKVSDIVRTYWGELSDIEKLSFCRIKSRLKVAMYV